MHVRRVRPEDNIEWIRMRDILWPGLPLEVHQADITDFEQNQISNAIFVVDREDGRLGGFLEAGTRKYADGCESSPVAYIEGWYVDADLRQTGCGRALVDAAENWARSIGCTEIASDCLLENEVSLKAHTALGYLETERLIHFRKSLTNVP